MRHSPASLMLRFLFMLALLSPTLAASAQDADGTVAPAPNDSAVQISIFPKGTADGARFETELGPGESVELTAVITNYGAEPIELRTFTSNIVPAVNGGLRLADKETEHSGTTLWMEYPTEEFTLASQESIERSIVITVPADTPPGQYVNAVALETVKPVNEGGGNFEQFFRKVVSVYITVPGEMTADFAFGEPEVLVVQGRSGLQLPVTNTGNVRIDLTGDLSVTDMNGSVVHQGEVRLGPIYAGQDTIIQIPFAAVPPAGDYTVDFTFTDVTTEVSKSTEELAVVIPEDESGEASAIFENVTVVGSGDPIVFADVSVDVTIPRATYSSAKLTIIVYHEGELVEEFVLAQNLSLPQGTTSVTQRYLPATGWESGMYSFSLKLESTDGGQTSLVQEEEDVATLEVP